MEHISNLTIIFKVLSADARLRILQSLKRGPLCVEVLSARLDVTQGAVSQHLRVLRLAGLVRAERRGYYVHYRLRESALHRCKEAIDRLLSLDREREASTKRKKGGKPCLKRNKIARSRRN